VVVQAPQFRQTYCALCFATPQQQPQIAEPFFPEAHYEHNPKLLKFLPSRVCAYIRYAARMVVCGVGIC
jgi:hypothetical protein